MGSSTLLDNCSGQPKDPGNIDIILGLILVAKVASLHGWSVPAFLEDESS